MKTFKPVTISTAAFVFCRFSIAIIIWLALFLQIKWLVLLAFVILLASAILGIKRAPMIVLYTYTINLIFPSKSEMLDEKAMRFAHYLGSILSFICLITLYFINERVGWIFLALFAVLKTISALGFCPASKLYSCMISGGCCALTKRK